MIQYRDLHENEICRELFKHFIRRQDVAQCWRKENGTWVIKDISFIDDWSENDYAELISYLKHTLCSGGLVRAAFYKHELKGFVSVERNLFGGLHKYLDLSHIYVSADMRGQGIGAALFTSAKIWASTHGAGKLYISAHSAVESQAFYKKMGCREAAQYDPAHVLKEPCDCQLECVL